MPKQSDKKSLQNHFLISMPQMLDPNFSGTLTYICDHNEHGAMGIVVNRPVDLSLGELLEQLDLQLEGEEQVVFAGGPVQQDRGFILHNGRQEWESTLSITPDLNLTTSKDILSAIADNKGPSKYLVALGYAGWGEGQLEQELTENTWICCPANEEILFNSNSEKKLKLAMSFLGIEASQLNGQIGHA